MPLAYISYCHETDEFVTRLVRDLRRYGVSVFYDKMLSPGEAWERALSNVLRRADSILLILSPGYLMSRATREMELALQREVDEGVIRAIAVHAVDSDIPYGLKGKVYVDFREEENYERGLQELVRAIRPASENGWPLEISSEDGTLALHFDLNVLTASRICELGSLLSALDGITQRLLSVSDKEYATSLAARYAQGIPIKRIEFASPLQVKLDLGVADLVHALRELIRDLWYRNKRDREMAALETRAKEIELAERLIDLVSRRDRELKKFERSALAMDIVPLLHKIRDQALLAFLGGISGRQADVA